MNPEPPEPAPTGPMAPAAIARATRITTTLVVESELGPRPTSDSSEETWSP